MFILVGGDPVPLLSAAVSGMSSLVWSGASIVLYSGPRCFYWSSVVKSVHDGLCWSGVIVCTDGPACLCWCAVVLWPGLMWFMVFSVAPI